MTKRFVSLTVVVLVLLLLVGALLAQQIGGVSIRLIETERGVGLSVPELVLRGVPTAVAITGVTTQSVVMTELVWETAVDAHRLQTVRLSAESVPVVFPCAGSAEGRLVLRQLPDQQVLATTAVQLLEAGEDCALK